MTVTKENVHSLISRTLEDEDFHSMSETAGLCQEALCGPRRSLWYSHNGYELLSRSFRRDKAVGRQYAGNRHKTHYNYKSSRRALSYPADHSQRPPTTILTTQHRYRYKATQENTPALKCTQRPVCTWSQTEAGAKGQHLYKRYI